MAREQWSSFVGVLMAAAGSAIGLGSLWRFPYLVGVNGGGLFVLSYLLCTFVVALPLFVAELMIGRKTLKGPIDSLTELGGPSPYWRFTGWMCVITCFIILSFYSVVSGWGIHYFLLSFQHFSQNKSPLEIARTFDVLYRAGDLNIFWHAVFMIITTSIVVGGVKKGIEKWSQVLTPGLFVLFLVFLGYCAFLPGFWQALHFMFTPNWELFSPSTILEALGVSFFSMSVGLGILITYGSYLKSTQSIPSLGLKITLSSLVISLISSIVILSLAFSSEQAPGQGPGLIFKTLPILFEQLPGTRAIGSLFFFIFFLTALTSAISLMEVLVSSGMDLWQWSRKKSAIIAGSAAFIAGLPSALSGCDGIFPSWKIAYGQDFFTQINHLPDWLLSFNALSIFICCGWYWHKTHSVKEYMLGWQHELLPLGKLSFSYWHFLVRWLSPLAIFSIILKKFGIF